MNEKTMLNSALYKTLDDNQAINIQELDVSKMTSIADTLFVASGTSTRQVRSLAEKIVETAKGLGICPLGVEGEQEGDWVLVDLGDVIVHIMHPTTRAYYQLEKLWSGEEHRAVTAKG